MSYFKSNIVAVNLEDISTEQSCLVMFKTNAYVYVDLKGLSFFHKLYEVNLKVSLFKFGTIKTIKEALYKSLHSDAFFNGETVISTEIENEYYSVEDDYNSNITHTKVIVENEEYKLNVIIIVSDTITNDVTGYNFSFYKYDLREALAEWW